MQDPDILVDTWFLLAPEQRLILEQRLDDDTSPWLGLMPWQADRDAATAAPTPDLDTGC